LLFRVLLNIIESKKRKAKEKKLLGTWKKLMRVKNKASQFPVITISLI
jgi:hypothetical protein